MKRRYSLVIATLFTLLSTTAVAADAPGAAPLNRIVAIANNDIITQTELDDRINTISQQIRQRGTQLPPLETLRSQVLERLIVDKLQRQLAETTGIRVDDETLNSAIARIASDNKLSLGEFRKALERDGFVFEKFREDIRNEITLRRLQERQVNQRVMVTEQEVDQYLENRTQENDADKSYHLAHILVATPDAPTPVQIDKAKQRVDEILAKLKAGQDFAQLAIAYSDGQQALDGGDIGWRNAAELPTLFTSIVPHLAVNEVSDIIRGPNGFHLIKLLESKGAKQQLTTQTHARHILIKTNTVVSDDAAIAKLTELKQQITAGGDFAHLAQTFSDDKSSATKGGDLDWINPGDTVPAFETVMDTLQPGEISEPFQSSFGWHLLQVIERRTQDTTAEFRRRNALQSIRQRRIEEETESWLRRLRDEAYVEYRLKEHRLQP